MLLRTLRVAVAAALLALSVTAHAQTPSGLAIGDGIVATGSLRARSYSWDWFGDAASGDYTYPASLLRVGLFQKREGYEWVAELAAPILVGLPSDAVAPPPQGQLGLGGAYVAANGGSTTTASLFLKQAYGRLNRLAGVDGQSLKFGRLEFNDGAETVPANDTLAALKRERISQRLLGTFGFSDVGRSIDGVLYSRSTSGLNVTALAGRPTQGVFDVRGWPELSINLFYGAVTRQAGSDARPAEWRVFAIGYDDRRDGIVKTDNRPLAARTADTGGVTIGTYGGHYLQTAPTPAGPVDVLVWGAIQNGSWGALTQRAGAFAAEAGWQPAGLPTLRPWIRAGFDYGSGDGNPGDTTHGTFFQILPTPRVYARLPFFNMMNTEDAFGELVLRPSSRVTVRADAHALRLANASDLWYAGGGAFQPDTFGYTGRPSGGRAGLATLVDASGDYALNAHVALNAYYGYAVAQPVPTAIYPSGGGAGLGYLELLLRF